MTIWGVMVGLIFVVCYVGMTYSTSLEGTKSKAVLWGCWLFACVVMLACYSISPSPAG